MRQKSLNDNMTSRGKATKAGMSTDILDIDDLLDDEGWNLLNSLTEEELEQLNADFDPENSFLPIGERGGHMGAINSAPMFSKEDLVENLEKMVANSKPVIKNEKIRQKEEEKKKVKEAQLKKQYSRERYEPDPEPKTSVTLTEEEEALLNEATEEELIEAAALLKMNGMLTNDQINSVFAGEKPQGASIKTSTAVKATKIPPKKIVAPTDEETELDVVKLMKHLKEDSDSLFYLCVNNQPRLEKQVKQAIIRAVETSKKMKHLSLAMTGLIDADVKVLAKSIRYNEQLETLNLESNVITNSGLDALMKIVARHPSLREIKISNQKQPFGGQGEAIMADAIDGNENILKFGYSFKQPGPRNKADRAIIRHNDNLRQKRRNGEDVYDLKAVCKIRDPWPQPWIISKGRRLLGGLIEAKVTEMGHMIDPDDDVRRESRGPRLSDKEAKPLDINALLSARKEKLRGTKIAQLEEAQEQKNKRLMQEMMESTKPPKENETSAENDGDKTKLGKAADIVQLNGHDDPKMRNKKYEELDDGKLDHGPMEESPPKSIEKIQDEKKEKKKPLGKGLKIATLGDTQTKVMRRRHQEEGEEETGLNFDEFEVKPTEEKKPKNEPVKKGVKIASLDNDEPTVPRRRKKKFGDDEEEGGVNFDDFASNEPPKEETKPVIKETEILKSEEAKQPADKKKKLSREGGAKIVANFTETEEVPRRRRQQRSFDSEEEKVEQTAEEKKEEESRKQKLLKNAKNIKAELPDHGLVRRRKVSKEQSQEEYIDPFSNVAKKVSKLPSPEEIRRRREIAQEEEEIDPFKALEERKKQEEKERLEAEAKAKKMAEEEEKRKLEEHRHKLADIEGRKKKLSLEGGKKVVAAFEPIDTIPRRRRKPKYEDEPEENEFLKVEAKPAKEEEKAEVKNEEEKTESVVEAPAEEEVKETKKEEKKKIWSREGGRKIVGLTPVEDTMPVRKRRSKKFDDDDDLGLKLEEDVQKKETSEVPKVEERKVEESKKRILGGKRVAALPPPEEKVTLRRRKKDEDENEKIDPIALVEKTEMNAVRVAAKNIKGLPPPDTGITKRRRRKDEDEEIINPFASVPEKVEQKKEEIKPEEKKVESEKTKEPIKTQKTEKEESKMQKNQEPKKVDKALIAERAKKIVALPPPDEGITPIRRRRRRDDDDESDPFAVTKTEEISGRRSRTTRPQEDNNDKVGTRRSRNESENGGKWYTDEETKSGDRRFEKPEEKKNDDGVDIFASRDDDNKPRLSLRERMARRGR